MDVTPQELRSSEIKDSWRGYDRDDVDDLLERAAVTIEHLTQKLQDAGSRPAPVAAAVVEPAPLPSNREDAEMIQRTLLLAQRAADDAVNEAQAHARTIVDEAETKAQTLVSEAETNARRIAEGERRRLETELQDLAQRREILQSDADALDQYASGYRDRLRAAIEADLAQLSGTIDPPGPRPTLHDVDVPTPSPAPAASPSPAPIPVPSAGPATEEHAVIDLDRSGSGGRDEDHDEPSWDAPTGRAADAAEASARSAVVAPVVAPPRPSAEWPPAPAAADAATSSWLSSDDDWSAESAALDAAAPWEREGTSPTMYAADVPMEAPPIDSDSLDDDAFFASLREAVRDDAPLGPRDEEHAFFDEESEVERRRFRRRR